VQGLEFEWDVKLTMKGERRTVYQSFLLRLWMGTHDDEWVSRVSLENVQTHERWSFTSLDDFFVFLKQNEVTVFSNHSTSLGGE
jgi:hypothetical protein